MNRHVLITLYTCELLADLRATGWRVADMMEAPSSHTARQWADICEPGNLQTVTRALLLAWAEALPRIGATPVEPRDCADDLLVLPERFVCDRDCPEGTALVTRRLHAWMIAVALATFASSVPGISDSEWLKRRQEALADLPSSPGSTGSYAFRRRIGIL